MESKLQDLLMKLRRGQIYSSYQVALKTLEIVRIALSSMKWTSTQDAINHIKEIGRTLTAAAPLELAIGNIVRRVCYLIREEHASNQKKENAEAAASLFVEFEPPALYNMLGNAEQDLTKSYNIKGDVLNAVDELVEELNTLYKNIAEEARDHIHANEIVMTFGSSHTVEEFLKYAAKKRSFGLVVAESAPSYSGRRMADSLSKAGIETTIITDSAVFAMMARINKVIIGTHAVMANGGLIGLTGMHMLCQAAKHHSVPVVVCTGLYKLCPLYPNGQDTLNFLKSPVDVLKYEEADSLKGDVQHDVKNPAYDYIPPELVSLFITNSGGHNPSYIYRLLAEYYHPEDSDL